MINKALLIVDVQVAMFSWEKTLYQAEKVLENIAAILDRARKAKVPVFYVQHTSDKGLFDQGSPTWEIHPKITPLENETVVQKRTWDSFHETALQAELEKQDIHELIIVGMQTEFCLDTTCRRAFSLGYKSTLVKDAHSTFDSNELSAEQIVKHHNHVLGGRFVQLTSTDEIAAGIDIPVC